MKQVRAFLGRFIGVSTMLLTGCGSSSCANKLQRASGGTGGFDSAGNRVGGAALEGLGPLPPPATIDNDLFSTADRCAFCHSASGRALIDAASRDVSPYRLWRRSMMGFSGRDPYWLAAFSHEIADNPAAKDTIETTCTRCHAPAAAVTLGKNGSHVRFDDITTSLSNEAHLARAGVDCAVCHQIKADNLGRPSSFAGNYLIGTERLIYGPHQNPFPMPMRHNVNFTPTYSTHITDSGLCATCHTVITRALDNQGNSTGPEVPEQVPYLEWQNSSFFSGADAVSCAGCHLPVTDHDGNVISTRISNRPPFINPRSPIGRHLLVGGNAYMLGIIAENAAWAGTNLPQSEFEESEKDAKDMLASAATIRITKATWTNGQLALDVTVDNHSGHKFPTSFPSRRAWIRLTVKDAAGMVIFDSGRFDDQGNIVDAQGQRIDGPNVVLPHRDEITSDSQVQVYESILSDASGAPTHMLLRATGFVKDNRLLPAGWSAAHPTAGMTKPIGLSGDSNFMPATDLVTYRLAVPAGRLEISAELLFQTVPPTAADVLSGVETKAAITFTTMMRARPPIPVRVSSATTTVP